MIDSEAAAWQTIAAVRGVGAKALWQAAAYLFAHGKPASWLLANPDKAREALRGIALHPLAAPPAGEETAAAKEKISLLHPLHPAFPLRIRELLDKLPLPAIIYASGNLSLLDNPGVAIVGSRAASAAALSVAEKLAREIVAAGATVVSGYAAGIDSAAHIGALRGHGTTIMVLAEGLDHFRLKTGFPGLLNDGNALVLSQFAPAAKWAAFQAMARNKLVAALAGALVVIASGPERDAGGRMSGSFDAGLAALKAGIPVFAVSPSFFAAPPAGNRELIARGGIAWDPVRGAAPLVAAAKARSARKKAGQKNLF
jgi:DNA processing protein